MLSSEKGGKGNSVVTAKGYRISSWCKENVLKLIMVVIFVYIFE